MDHEWTAIGPLDRDCFEQWRSDWGDEWREGWEAVDRLRYEPAVRSYEVWAEHDERFVEEKARIEADADRAAKLARVKARLTGELGYLSEATWEHLVGHLAVGDCLDRGGGDEIPESETELDKGAKDAIRDLATEYRLIRLLATRRPDGDEPEPDSNVEQERAAFAVCLAERAGEEESVMDFRHRVMPDGLMTEADALKWVSDPGSVDYVVFERWVALSEYLARRYVWQPRPAAIFILTGIAPTNREIACFFRHHEIPRLSRIRVSFSPFVPPSELVSEVLEARATFLEETSGSKWRRPRPGMAKRQHALARFVVDKRGQVTEGARRLWNDLQGRTGHVDWGYSRTDSFQRAVRRAMQQLGLEYPTNAPEYVRDERAAVSVVPKEENQGH